MKTTIFYVALLFACVTTSQAQTNYYKEDKIFKEEGYEYLCDVLEGARYVTLCNKADKYSQDDVVYKSTGEPFSSPMWQGKRGLFVIEPAPTMLNEARQVVGSAFTVDEVKKFNGHNLSIILFIDSDKGNVVGVHFNFLNIQEYANVPVSKYREIELALKENIHFTPTELGRQLKVIMIGWSQRPTGYIELPPSPLRPVED